jgi:long-chain acyl-CoA synthetase
MSRDGTGPGWWRAEQEYTDEIIRRETLAEMFDAAVERYGDAAAQRYKGGVYDRSLTPDVVPAAPDGRYASLSYAEMGGLVRRLTAGFRELGVTAGDCVGIYADTRMEWAHSDFALLAAGAVVTTVYTESSADRVQYLLDDPDAVGVVVENESLLDTLASVEDDLDLSFVVVMDEYDRDADRADLYRIGDDAYDEDSYREWLGERSPDDLASLIYTSGTTGKPKGVRLTHENFRENVNQARKRIGPRPDKPEDVPTLGPHMDTISFLPLAHVLERMAGHFQMFACGTTVGYAESPDTVGDDIELLRPNVGISVPRVYERIFDQMRQQASESPVKQRIFEWAVEVGKTYSKTDSPGPLLRAKHALADRLVYSTVRESLGGNVDFFVSGGGSLSADLAHLFLAMDLTILEGYGLTETSPVVSVNPPEDVRPGTMGPPVTDVDFRVDEDIVADDQFPAATGTVGELLVTGPNVTDGYWNMPGRTKRAFTDDGFFRTGDIVEVTDDDYLVYKDRIKRLLVLSTGKNVSPGHIEDRFSTSDRVDQIMVVGDGRKFVAAVIVPDFEAMDRWADEAGVDLPESYQARCRDERVREWVGETVAEVNDGLEPVERIKRFELVSEEWTPDNDLLTPSMKKKRRNITAAYEDRIERLYEEADIEADD